MRLPDLATVRVEVAGGVGTMTLDRPEHLNAWTRELGDEMLLALRALGDAPEVRAIVITGAGRAFSSGADLRDGGLRRPDGSVDVLTPLRESFNPVLLAVRETPKPVVAAVRGAAAGIGCSLALACDLVLAADSAYFLLAFVNIGLGLDGGASQSLVARVGHGRAAEMALLGDRIGAGQALAWGLANRVVDDAALAEEAAALAARLAAGPPGSYATIKATLNRCAYAGFRELLDEEAVRQQERVGSRDFAEGVSAFMEKRAPRFTGA